VDKKFTRREADDFVRRDATVGATDPEVRRFLDRAESLEKVWVSARLLRSPGSVVGKKLWKQTVVGSWWSRVLYFDIAFFLKQDSVELSFSQIHVIKNYDPTGQAKGKNRRPDSGWSLPLTGILGGAAAGEIKGEGPLRMDQPYSRQVSTSSPSIPRIMGPHL